MVGVWIEPVIAQLMMILLAISFASSLPAVSAFPGRSAARLARSRVSSTRYGGALQNRDRHIPELFKAVIYDPQIALFAPRGKAASRTARRSCPRGPSAPQA